MTTVKQTATALAIASPAFALDAYEAQRAGSIEAILAGQAAKLGGATSIDGMTSKSIRTGLSKLDAAQETVDYLLAKHERDTSCFVKRGRVWLHVLFNEPDAVAAVDAASVVLREELGHALAGTGSHAADEEQPTTIAAARNAVSDRVAGAVEVARENGKPVSPRIGTLAKQLNVKGHTTLKVKKAGESSPKGAQKRMTLNALAENFTNVTRGPASWLDEDGLKSGRVVAVRFDSEVEAQAFVKAIEDAADKNK